MFLFTQLFAINIYFPLCIVCILTLLSLYVIRSLRIINCIYSNKDEISQDRLADANLLVFGGPREPFSVADFNVLKAWLGNGGRALILLGDGGESASGCNMNYLLEE